MPITGTVPITAPIAPTLETASYPVTDPAYGKGSLRTVGTTADMYAISQLRREKGMLVYVIQDGGGSGQYYSLIGGTSNDDWTVFSPLGAKGADGAVGATGPQLLIINSFSTDIPKTILKGSSNSTLSGNKMFVTYEGDIVPATGAVYLTDPTKGTGFPVYFSTGGMTGINFTSQTVTGAVGEAITLRLVVTGQDGSTDKQDYVLFMGNEFRWGATTGASLTGGDLTGTLTNTQVVTGANIDFIITGKINEYAYYAYPKSMGQSRQSINNASYGGMALQGHDWAADAGGLSSFNHPNSLGYAEDFYVYRSDHLYIGRNARVKVYEEPA